MLTLWMLLLSLTLTWGYWEAPEDEPVLEILEFLGGSHGLRTSLMKKMRPSVSRHIRTTLDDDIPVNPAPYIIVCSGCMFITDTMNAMVDEGLEFQDVREEFLEFCDDLLGALDERSTAICPGIVDLQIKHVFTIFKNRTVTSEEACRTVNFCRDEHIAPLNPVLTDAKIKTKTLAQHKSPEKKIETMQNPLKVVQLTDIHVEPEYAEGSATDCGLPVCCRQYWEGEHNTDSQTENQPTFGPRKKDAILWQSEFNIKKTVKSNGS